MGRYIVFALALLLAISCGGRKKAAAPVCRMTGIFLRYISLGEKPQANFCAALKLSRLLTYSRAFVPKNSPFREQTFVFPVFVPKNARKREQNYQPAGRGGSPLTALYGPYGPSI